MEKIKLIFKDSVLVKEDGVPIQLYHGSLSGFADFDDTKIMPSSRDGKGIYLSSSPVDASDNYANPNSTEWQGKLMSREMTEGINYSDAKAELQETSRAVVYPVYAKLHRPYIINDDALVNLDRYSEPLKIALFVKMRDMSEASRWRDIIINNCIRKSTGEAPTNREFHQELLGRSTQLGVSDLFGQVCRNSSHDGIINYDAGKIWHTPDDAYHVTVFDADRICFSITGKFSRDRSKDISQSISGP